MPYMWGKRMKLCKTSGGGRGPTTWEASLTSLGHSKYYASSIFTTPRHGILEAI